MTYQRRYCPVCHRHVRPTRGGNVEGHFTTTGDPCGMAGEPYTLALTGRPKRTPVGAA